MIQISVFDKDRTDVIGKVTKKNAPELTHVRYGDVMERFSFNGAFFLVFAN